MATARRTKALVGRELAETIDKALDEAFRKVGFVPTASSKEAPKPAQPERWSPSMRTAAEQAAAQAMDGFFKGARVGNTAGPTQPMDSFAKVGEARPQPRGGFSIAAGGRPDQTSAVVATRWAQGQQAAEVSRRVEEAAAGSQAEAQLSDPAKAALGITVAPRR